MRLVAMAPVGLVLALGAWAALRPAETPGGPPPAPRALTLDGPVATPSRRPHATAPPAGPGPLAGLADAAAREDAATFMAEAAAARTDGDLRATVELLQAAVERAPSIETHAALGGLYLEMGVAAAEVHLRAAVEGDARNADRWIALANALARKPDPIAAAEALERARTIEPSLRIGRDAQGWLVRAEVAP